MFDIGDRMFGNLHKRARSRGGRHFLGLSHRAISIFQKECNAERLVKCLTAKVSIRKSKERCGSNVYILSVNIIIFFFIYKINYTTIETLKNIYNKMN